MITPHRPQRRRFMTGAVTIAAAACGLPAAARASVETAQRTRVVLLGTRGGPRVGAEGRANPSTLVLVKGVPYLVDCGYRTTQQLVRAGIPGHRLRHVFITHQHSDHNQELGSVIYNSWVTGLKTRIDVYGPAPLDAMLRSWLDSYMAYDIDTRVADEGRPDLRKLVFSRELGGSGLVMQNDDVKVTALRVAHPPIEESYAYRFDAADRSIVISGDTAYHPPLAEFARGADVLVHEVMYLPGLERILKRARNATQMREHLLASHTVPEDVGRIAAAAGVKTVVLTHLVPGDDPTITEEMWTSGVRKHFAGEVLLGHDLMQI